MRGAAAKIGFSDARSSSGPQDFRLDSRLHLRVAALVCGAPASAVVDSGAARTVVDAAFAARLGIESRAGFRAAGVVGELGGGLAEDVSIRIGGFAMEDLSAGVLDLRPLSAPAERPIDVILGQELFSRTSIDIDFLTRKIVFAAPGRIRIPEGAVATPLRYRPGETPQCRVSLDGGPAVWAGFDLGYNATLLLSPDFVEQAGLLRGRRVSTVASQGVEGASISRISTIARLAVGGIGVEEVPVEVPPAWNRSVQAVLGLELLKRFRIVTDYSGGWLWLFPYASLLDQPLPKDRSGIGGVPTRAGIRVIHVARNSPAEAAGLTAGDRIVRIDGEAADLDYVMRNPRLGARPAGTRFSLGLASGRSLELELRDYY